MRKILAIAIPLVASGCASTQLSSNSLDYVTSPIYPSQEPCNSKYHITPVEIDGTRAYKLEYNGNIVYAESISLTLSDGQCSLSVKSDSLGLLANK